MSTLDRSRPFGTIYPAGEAAYEQDGRLFDAAGNMLGEPVPASIAGLTPRKPGRARKEVEAPAAPAPEVAAVVDSQLASQLQDD